MISVIINVYNGEKYIKRCIDSVINQTYKNLEILIINDGSTDNTLSICKSYNDKRIRIINQKNMGLSLARNVGLDNAKGDYFYFVDADDYIDKDTIEYLYNLLKKYNAPMSSCEVIEVINDKYKLKNKNEVVKLYDDIHLLKRILLYNGKDGNIWNKLIKREVFNDLRFENRIINDVVVVYKLAIDLKRYVYSNIPKYYYYRHSDSILGRHKIDHSIDYYKAALERYDYIKKIYPNLKENDYSLLWSIITLYGHNNKDLDEYLDNKNAKELFKKLFSLKVLFVGFRFKDKIKILLFRISPKIYKKCISIHINNKKR